MAIRHFETDEQTARNRAANAWAGEYIGPVVQNGVPAYEWRTHFGLCLEMRTRPMLMDSYYDDFGMVVFLPGESDANPMLHHGSDIIWYHSNRDESPLHTVAEVDAFPEVRAAYESNVQAQRAEAARKAAHRAELEAIMRPEKGKRLEVIRGRKVPRGTVGECIWVGQSNYGTRVGIKDANGNVHWTAITNVQVV